MEKRLLFHEGSQLPGAALGSGRAARLGQFGKFSKPLPSTPERMAQVFSSFDSAQWKPTATYLIRNDEKAAGLVAALTMDFSLKEFMVAGLGDRKDRLSEAMSFVLIANYSKSRRCRDFALAKLEGNLPALRNIHENSRSDFIREAAMRMWMGEHAPVKIGHAELEGKRYSSDYSNRVSYIMRGATFLYQAKKRIDRVYRLAGLARAAMEEVRKARNGSERMNSISRFWASSKALSILAANCAKPDARERAEKLVHALAKEFAPVISEELGRVLGTPDLQNDKK